jgi:signal transduction histidine kinase
LSNASRHAHASGVEVLVSAGETVVVVQVSDDGTGLPQEVAESGLRNMRERAVRLGGSFVVTSVPGEGTTVTWTVPVSAGR